MQSKVLQAKNRGPAVARNLGMKNATGDIIGLTDDDCVVEPDWVENAVKDFEDETVGGFRVLLCQQAPSLIRKNYIIMLRHQMWQSKIIHMQHVTYFIEEME